MPKLFYERWIDAVTSGDIRDLEVLHEEDNEYLTLYRSVANHQATRKLPVLGMNSVHLAAFSGQPKVLEWMTSQAPELLDVLAETGELPCDLCVRGLRNVRPGAVQVLKRFVETLRIFGPERLRPGLPLALRKLAAYAWHAKQSRQDADAEIYLGFLREMLTDVRSAFGDDNARDAALEVSGLEPAWELMRETDPAGTKTTEWAELALVRALQNHPETDARAFFETIPLDVASHLKQCPKLLEECWLKADGDLARFLLGWCPDSKREAISAAVQAKNLPVVLAALDLPQVAPPNLPFQYLLWHLALGRAVSAAALSQPLENFRLYYTPRYLANVWSDLFPGLSAEDAEGNLLAATAEAYRALVRPGGLQMRDPLRGFAERGTGYPLALPFLVVSVIAASHMETGRNVTASNYYDRLGEVLGYSLNPPPSFETETFRGLWQDFAQWLPKPSRLHLPAGGFVNIPQEHVLLRATDLDRLDRYFEARRFEVRAQIPPERLQASFKLWASNHLTGAAQDAMQDARGPAVLWQVSSELSRWDGSTRERAEGTSSAMRVAILEPSLYPLSRPGQYEVQLIAPRPDGFPATFPEVLGLAGADLETDGNQAYYPVVVRPEAQRTVAGKLLDGWHTTLISEGRRLRLQMLSRKAIPFRASENDVALVATSALPLRASAQLLCHESVEGMVTQYLSEACVPASYRRSVKSPLPSWVLFQDVQVTNARVEPPPPIGNLRPETSLEVRFEGGMRLGRGQEWLSPGAPSLRFSGEYKNLTLNSEEVQPDDSGLVCLTAQQAAPGLVRIEANGFRTEIRMVEPFRREQTRPASHRVPLCLYPLVSGEWAILGARPGQIMTAYVPRGNGRVIALPFIPQWILEQDGTPRVYACGDGSDGAAEQNESGSVSPEALALWTEVMRSPRTQFRAGRFSDLSQKQVERDWQMFWRDNGPGEPPLASLTVPPPFVPRKGNGPKDHSRKGKKRR